jgi:glycine hydroxymethyltransferase
VDVVETLAIERAKKLFGAEHANVQPHSGSQANMAVYLTVLKPGDTVMGLPLAHGGHLTHGHHLNFSGKYFKFVPYGLRRETETIDYEELDRLAREHKPKLIVVGASAYPRTFEFERIAKTARETGAMMMVDIAHIAGLVAAGEHPTPVPYAEFVTSTTHKTLRGPRSGLVLCRETFAKDLNRSVFPEMQGGPLVHVIAAKAVCFRAAATDEFKTYTRQVLKNAKTLAAQIASRGFRVVSGGTDTHLFLVDVFSRGINGKQAEEALDKAGITVNKNAIPFDQNPPLTPSGIRIGTPALTTRGMKEGEMEAIGGWIVDVLEKVADESVQKRVRKEVETLCEKFPLY